MITIKTNISIYSITMLEVEYQGDKYLPMFNQPLPTPPQIPPQSTLPRHEKYIPPRLDGIPTGGTGGGRAGGAGGECLGGGGGGGGFGGEEAVELMRFGVGEGGSGCGGGGGGWFCVESLVFSFV